MTEINVDLPWEPDKGLLSAPILPVACWVPTLIVHFLLEDLPHLVILADVNGQIPVIVYSRDIGLLFQ